MPVRTCAIGELYGPGRFYLTLGHSTMALPARLHLAAPPTPSRLGVQYVNANGRKAVAIGFHQGLDGLREGHE